MALFETLELIPAGIHSPADGPTHMAVDEQLIGSSSWSSSANPILRIYQWTRPAVTFGYFQSLREITSAYPDLPSTRRWTGGGAVTHGDPMECTYAMGIPRKHPFAQLRPRECYRRLHRAVADALRQVGFEALVVEKDHPIPNLSCFQNPVEGDVVLPSGLKLAGAAQRRTQSGLLIQGSIRLPEAIPSNLQDALVSQCAADPRPAPAIPPDAIEVLARTKYGSSDWRQRVP